jgi:hypothetical protein
MDVVSRLEFGRGAGMLERASFAVGPRSAFETSGIDFSAFHLCHPSQPCEMSTISQQIALIFVR